MSDPSPDTPNAYAPRCGHHGNPLVWLDPALRWRCPHCFPELFPDACPAAGSSPPDYTALAEQLRAVKHYESEDCWYSCPESEEGCCNDGRTGCDCHAPTMWAAADALEAQAARITELEAAIRVHRDRLRKLLEAKDAAVRAVVSQGRP